MILRFSNLFLRTLRQDPSDAEVASHRLLVRAGYIRRAAPGIYTWLPLGLRVLSKVERIVREEMARAGAQEVHFPALLPKEPFEATGRWQQYGDNLFRLKDRKDADYLLAPTHEEMFTLLVKDLYSSYKDLPVTLFQIQTKFRDEARPRAGLIRGREFIMKDAYSFDLDDAGLQISYQKQREAYERIFTRLGLEYVIVSATAGAMGGSRSEEFLTPTEIGEDTFVRSPGGFAANVEAIVTEVTADLPRREHPELSLVSTPNTESIEDVVTFLNANNPKPEGHTWSSKNLLKTIVCAKTTPEGEREVFLYVVPGDRQVDFKRLEAHFAPAEVEPATEADFKRHPQLVKGFIGPQESVSVSDLDVYIDVRIPRWSAWAAGGNIRDTHALNVVFGRDFDSDLRLDAVAIQDGDPAPDGSGPLEIARGIEIGHIFQLGQLYTKALGLQVLDQNGKLAPVTMGSYGIGVSRVVAALAQQNCDEKGLNWPLEIAPAQVHLVVAAKEEAGLQEALKQAEALSAQGLEVFLDDRVKVSPGVKFADAELIGVPIVVVFGRGLKDGNVEIRLRGEDNTEVALSDLQSKLLELVAR